MEKEDDMKIKNKLDLNIERLAQEIKILSSNKRSFVRGIFFGVGTTIGATVVAAIFLAALLWFLKIFQNVSFVNSIIEFLNIEKYI